MEVLATTIERLLLQLVSFLMNIGRVVFVNALSRPVLFYKYLLYVLVCRYIPIHSSIVIITWYRSINLHGTAFFFFTSSSSLPPPNRRLGKIQWQFQMRNTRNSSLSITELHPFLLSLIRLTHTTAQLSVKL